MIPRMAGWVGTLNLPGPLPPGSSGGRGGKWGVARPEFAAKGVAGGDQGEGEEEEWARIGGVPVRVTSAGGWEVDAFGDVGDVRSVWGLAVAADEDRTGVIVVIA